MKMSKFKRLAKSRLKKRWTDDTISVFCVGFLIGIFIAVWLYHNQDTGSNYSVNVFQYFAGKGINLINDGGMKLLNYGQGIYDFQYETWLKNKFGLKSDQQDPDNFRYGINGTSAKYSNCSGFIVESEANFLFSKVPVICVIFNPESTDEVTAVANTWGRTCNELRFYYASSRRAHLPKEDVDVKFNVSQAPNNENLVKKVKVMGIKEASSEFSLLCRAFRQIWKHHRKMALGLPPWIMIAPHNSFVLTENLRFYVAPLNTTKPHYLGHAMKFWGSVYNWADAGYAISWETLHRLMDKFRTNEECDAGGKFWKNGDWYLGKHLASMGIRPVDTRDHIGKDASILSNN